MTQQQTIDGELVVSVGQGRDADLVVNGPAVANGTTASNSHISSTSVYSIPEQPIKKPRKLRVVAIGAGIAGLALLYKTRELKEIEIQVFEKNHDVGGVWLENRYPGCSCDIPAHIYCYSFEGNPNWTRYYAEAEEIYEYYRSFAKKYNLYERIQLQQEVISAVWVVDENVWSVQIKDLISGAIFDVTADVLVNASGALSNYKWPDITDISKFKGKLVHSASWDKEYCFEGKAVGIIGAGASAVQILPRIQPVAKTLTTFNRSKVWIASEFVDAYAPDGRNTMYTPEMIERFGKDPDHLREYRQMLTEKMCQIFDMFNREHPIQQAAFKKNTESMRKRLNNREDLVKQLIPEYPVGCRRTTPATGYLEALTQPNTKVVTSTIVKATETGLVTADGETHEFDAIIAATGFDTSFRPAFPVLGLQGKNLGDVWKETPKAYLSLAVPGFPNYFVMNGPNAPFANGSLVYGIECEADYIIRCVQKIQTERIKYIDVKQDALDDWIEHKDEYMKRMVWSADCSSWYKNGKPDGPVIGPWPGSIIHFANALEIPRFEDFNIVYQQRNRFAFFGNGRSMKEALGEPLSYYITA